jgi:Zn-dependent protease/predicted transcriptional regulator
VVSVERGVEVGMSESLRLGRIAGINVGINWSVLVIFVLVTAGLAYGRFPTLQPDLEPVTYWAAGLVAGVVFFLSLLAHEMSHAIVARRNGVGVEGITLWLFGGVAKLQGEAPDPGAELRISGVGPLVSVLLAGAFAVVAALLHAAEVAAIVVEVFVWLALINGILAAFNLVPAAPLDGGRILRSILWRRRGDRFSAAITASRAGRTFGWVLVALGLLEFVGGAGLAGLWLVLIGWFLTMAAGAEEQHAITRHALAGVRARDVMTPEPTSAPAGITVEQLLDDYVFRNRHSTFPLLDGDQVVGLATLSRVKQVRADLRATTPVTSVACPPADVAVVGPDEPLEELLTKVTTSTDGRVLVLDHGRLVGIISPSDVTRQIELGLLREPADRM